MAARALRKTHQDDVRAKIQTSQLVNRLNDHALGIIELTASQIKAIEILIRKTLPDLQAITMDMNATVEVERYDLDRLDDRELDTVERVLLKAAVAGGSEGSAGAEETGSLH